jgi:two-component system sensor histidine kinase EvgS
MQHYVVALTMNGVQVARLHHHKSRAIRKNAYLFTKRSCVVLVALAFPLIGTCAFGEPPTPVDWLTREERVWIREHPSLRVVVLEHAPPIEWMHGDIPEGLSIEYLGAISRASGLKFTYVGSTGGGEKRLTLLRQGKADMISAIRNIGPSTLPGIALTSPYHINAAIVITRVKTSTIYSLDRLQGKTVVVDPRSPFESLLRVKVKNIRIIRSGSASEALQLVARGDADATIGTDSHLIPYLGPKFDGVLQISGVITQLASDMSMAVRDDQTVLYSILQKSLNRISAEDSYDLHNEWLTSSSYGDRALKSFTEDYSNETIIAVLVMAILLGLMYQTHREHRRAVRSEREKAKFLAIMSHEIRSPMNAVLAAVELLSLTKLDHDQRHLSALASNGASTLLRLLDDVLDMSKLEAEQLRLELEPVDIYDLCSGIMSLYKSRADAKGIELTLEVQGEGEGMLLDEARVTQILHNLISNAIKFTDAGSVHVTATVGDAYDGDLKQLDISVTDTGIGISEQAQEKLFEPYAQANNSYKRSGGTGLGLLICRELIELMGGIISLTSSKGVGTVLAFSIQAEAAIVKSKNTPSSNALSSPASPTYNSLPMIDERTSTLNILVVEDTLANQQVLLAQMHSLGIAAVLAPDGTQAILQFEQSKFDLVLLDCDLPDMDGYSVATKLRNHEAEQQQPRCPIVAISASTGSEHEERCFAVDMDGMLGKPIQLARLKSVIEIWCDVAITQKMLGSANESGLEINEISEMIQDDLLLLLGAILLGDKDAALHSAHRLNGAALSMNWVEFALIAQTIENSLRSALQLDDPKYGKLSRALIQHWKLTRKHLLASKNEK